ncbi:MAG: lycopene cyclase family protein [Ilumatobacter sp.]|uniref:lycopene cyclase family protein n=1 Tax=Ilumatobacter sp. TaxID=1967498 RepID=UPI00391CD7A8
MAEFADVVVMGDGPAGSALAARLMSCGVDVVLIGGDDDWFATYGTWADDVEAVPWLDAQRLWLHRAESVEVDVGGRRRVERPYGVIDNEQLRVQLRHDLRPGVEHRVERVVDVRTGSSRHEVVTSAGVTWSCRVLIDATGWPGHVNRSDRLRSISDVARQTAFGVVVEEPPAGPLGSVTLMDFSTPSMDLDDALGTIATFAYALPVHDGWLVEETVLAAHPPVDPERLAARLAARLGLSEAALRSSARRVESVDIAMGGPLPDRSNSIVGYGAAASMIHPATGYSIATSLTHADRVAAAIAEQVSDSAGVVDVPAIWEAIWPRSSLQTRVLHDYGLDVLLELDPDDVRSFFAAFFDLPVERWAAYLRIDTPPSATASIMLSMFRAAPWRLRRRLVSQNPLAFVRLVRS